MLDVTARDCSLGAILALGGVLTAATSQNLFQVVVQQAPKTPTYIFFDFSQLRYITAAGLRTLYKIYQMTRSDCQLIFCGAQASTQQVLSKVGFTKVIKSYDSVSAAQLELEILDQEKQEEGDSN